MASTEMKGLVDVKKLRNLLVAEVDGLQVGLDACGCHRFGEDCSNGTVKITISHVQVHGNEGAYR